MVPIRTQLGEVCVELGLLKDAQVRQVLDADLDTRLFGERARRLGLLSDESLARALAHQFRVNMVPGDRLARLPIAADVLALLPTALMRERLVLPTFLDPETRVLSLLVADPTDQVAQRAAQSATGAARVRVFVAARGGMQALLDRLLPTPGVQPAALVQAPLSAPRGLAVVFEPDGTVARALRVLAELEAGAVEVVTDVALVGPFLEAGEAASLVMRRASLPLVESRLAGWRSRHPRLRVRVVDGHGPAGRSVAGWGDVRSCLFAVLEAPIARLEPAVRARAERFVALATQMGVTHGLDDAAADIVKLAALWLAEVVAGDDDARLDEVISTAAAREAPLELPRILRAYTLRARGESGPGGDPLVEVLYTAMVAVREGLVSAADAVIRLGAGAARHDADALRALVAALGEGGRDA